MVPHTQQTGCGASEGPKSSEAKPRWGLASGAAKGKGREASKEGEILSSTMEGAADFCKKRFLRFRK